MKWYRDAADQGHAGAQNNLGTMYAHGLGVPQDYTEVPKWCRIAADQGNASAQYNLGVMYPQGQVVPRDYLQAHLWTKRAAEQGYEEAAKIRDMVAQKMTSAQIATAQKLARNYKPKK